MNDDGYVREKLGHTPKSVNTLVHLKDGLLRADLVRYMLLVAEGGIYTDIDTICLKPIDTWVPAHLKKEVNLVLGIEGDCLGGELISGFSQCVQFAIWTMMAKPGHFIMKDIMNQASRVLQSPLQC